MIPTLRIIHLMPPTKAVSDAFTDNEVAAAVTERYSVKGLVTTNVTQTDVAGITDECP